MSSIIQVENLTKRYGGKRGIDQVSFEVAEGEVFGFLGPNGAGKTTTIRLLMALLHADSGSARIAGLDCWDKTIEIKRLIGYVPGEPSLDRNLTGGQILEYFANLRGGVDRAYLQKLIERMDLKRYEITIAFAKPVPADAFAKLEGVVEVEPLSNGSAVRIAIQGAADAVIKEAAQYPVVSLTSYEPSLEDIFLRYYERDDTA